MTAPFPNLANTRERRAWLVERALASGRTLIEIDDLLPKIDDWITEPPPAPTIIANASDPGPVVVGDARDPDWSRDEPYIPAVDRIGTFLIKQAEVGKWFQVSNAAIAEFAECTVATVARLLGDMVTAGTVERMGERRARQLRVVLPKTGTAGIAFAEEVARERKAVMGPDAPRRRFSSPQGRLGKQLHPEAVHGLPADNPAVVEGRTQFPGTVVDPEDSPRLLVSGAHSSKFGDRVTKGMWKDMPLYQLTLEERATCPTSCGNWQTCYGNGMPLARRHRHGSELEERLSVELRVLAREHAAGFVVRLHTLGDFYSVHYVNLWAAWLDVIPTLRVFGYTARRAAGDDIGAAISALNERHPLRWVIRFSGELEDTLPLSATTLRTLPAGPTIEHEGTRVIVCPAQTRREVCCGSCGLCWAVPARQHAIGFILHGRKRKGGDAEPARVDMRREINARIADVRAPAASDWVSPGATLLSDPVARVCLTCYEVFTARYVGERTCPSCCARVAGAAG